MDEGLLHRARILIVDDNHANVLLLQSILRRAGCGAVFSALDATRAVQLFLECSPDLVLLDLHMPTVDGFQVLVQLQRLTGHGMPGGAVPVIVLTADETPQARQRALSGGAKDFLTKPFDSAEALLRIHNLLETRFLYLRLQEHNRALEDKVFERTRQLEEAQHEALERLALAAEYRDDDTGQHTYRVGRTAALLADALGLGASQAELLRRAAPLHDVGKIGVSDLILHKPAALDATEFERMKRHTVIGSRIVDGSRSPLLRAAQEVAISHHERWDGAGYPHRLAGEDIPLAGRIVAVADVFDALTHARPYKEAWPVERALAEMEAQRGRQFDARVVDAFLDLVRTHEAVLELGSARQTGISEAEAKGEGALVAIG